MPTRVYEASDVEEEMRQVAIHTMSCDMRDFVLCKTRGDLWRFVFIGYSNDISGSVWSTSMDENACSNVKRADGESHTRANPEVFQRFVETYVGSAIKAVEVDRAEVDVALVTSFAGSPEMVFTKNNSLDLHLTKVTRILIFHFNVRIWFSSKWIAT